MFAGRGGDSAGHSHWRFDFRLPQLESIIIGLDVDRRASDRFVFPDNYIAEYLEVPGWNEWSGPADGINPVDGVSSGLRVTGNDVPVDV